MTDPMTPRDRTEYDELIERRVRAMKAALEECTVPWTRQQDEQQMKTLAQMARATYEDDDAAGYAVVKKGATEKMLKAARMEGDGMFKWRFDTAIEVGRVKPEE